MLLCACAGRPGPGDVAERYARALREGHVEDALALTAEPEAGAEAFRARYASAEARAERAAEVRAELPQLEARSPQLLLVQTPAGWRVREAGADAAPRAALERFLEAAEAGRWPEAWSLLAGPLRARYTPERLGADFRAEPLARERLQRARAALPGPLVLEGAEARLELGQGRAVRLVREDGGYRVAALE
ncbi:hypothetical protein FGE12_00790 [Aggregicoccus sp. 17bor-14]|nr:hypothetical protein [Simulacricoccus sp. 17bor-14]MRI86696.1 hypothetical protein [Aggregicoccus sp. 17bor-14]